MNIKDNPSLTQKLRVIAIVATLILASLIFINIVSQQLFNESDGLFINSNTYVHGINDVIIIFVFVPFLNVCLFLGNIIDFFKKLILKLLKKNTANNSAISRWKKVVCIISLCLLLFSVLSVGSVEVTDESVVIKKSILSKEKTMFFEELIDYDLFVCDDNDVYWGKFTIQKENGESNYYNYDIYLGKLENNEKLLRLINEKSGRRLMGD